MSLFDEMHVILDEMDFAARINHQMRELIRSVFGLAVAAFEDDGSIDRAQCSSVQFIPAHLYPHVVKQFEQGLVCAKIAGARKRRWKTAINAALRILAPLEGQHAE